MNLPAVDKMVEPHFTMLWDHDIPRHVVTGTDGRTVEITVIAGELGGQVPPPPPPHSWAARADAEVAIWHVQFDPGGRWTMPPARNSDTVRTLYVFDGSGLSVDGHALEGSTGAVVTLTRRSSSPPTRVPSSCSCSKAVRSASQSPSTGRS